MTPPRPLYLFPHIPKTGGAKFFRNIERSLLPNQCWRLNFSYNQSFFDIQLNRTRFYKGQEDYKQVLQSLSTQQKAEIEFISGHDLPYQLHQHFSQPARYLLFVRDPIARTLSLYNYQRYQYEYLQSQLKLSETQWILLQFSKQHFLIDHKVPTFEQWLHESYDQKHPFLFTSTRFLRHYGYLQDKQYTQCLHRFFFIALTETLNQDSRYLYHHLHVNRYWSSPNASPSYVALSPKLTHLIHEKNQEDLEFYALAQQANAHFKNTHPDFHPIARRVQIQAIASFPLEKGIHWLKFLLRPILLPIRNRLRMYQKSRQPQQNV